MKINRINLKNLFLLFITLCTSSFYASEYITSFHADITVQQDGALLVTETIKAFVTGQNIKRGLYRDFPTVYWKNCLRSQVGFVPLKVLVDGEELSTFEVCSIERGKRVFMRGQELLEMPREHTFQLTYKTTYQLGFFNNHDELYWNVVGGDWKFVIHNASALVHFPDGVTCNNIHEISVYAGDLGNTNKGEDALIERCADNTVALKYLGVIKPGQAFTFVITWPKGFVQEPLWWQKKLRFSQNNIFFLFIILFLLSFLLAVFYSKYALYRRMVIPLFAPPAGFTPGMVRYFMKQNVDSLGMSADIISLAVQGFITIKKEKVLISQSEQISESYLLERTIKECNDKYYQKQLAILFAGRDKTCVLNKDKYQKMSVFFNHQNAYYWKKVGNFFQEAFYEKLKKKWVVIVAFYSGGIVLGLFFRSEVVYGTIGLCIIGIGIGLLFMCPVSMLYNYFVCSYTSEGLKIYDEIQGFKRFLSMTEKERLKFITTPPITTPELYEQMLPYAIALSVEKLWTKQFTSFFKAMEVQGHAYRNGWYDGPASEGYSDNFASSLSSSLSSSISSSEPGSSSGSDGGGSSGGGGGGGGGGGC